MATQVIGERRESAPQLQNEPLRPEMSGAVRTSGVVVSSYCRMLHSLTCPSQSTWTMWSLDLTSADVPECVAWRERCSASAVSSRTATHRMEVPNCG